EDPLIRLDHLRGSVAVLDALAEQRRVRAEAPLVQPAVDGDRVVECLPRDEARGAEPHPVLADEALPRVAACRREGAPADSRRDPTAISASGPTKMSRPSIRYGAKLSNGASETLSPARFGALSRSRSITAGGTGYPLVRANS